jgi:hypothetical protein
LEDLAEESSEVIYEDLFTEKSSWMRDEPLEWLNEYDYITSSINPDEKYPDWIRVRVEDLRKDLVEEINGYRNEEIGRYDGQENTEDYNGMTFYIYKVE